MSLFQFIYLPISYETGWLVMIKNHINEKPHINIDLKHVNNSTIQVLAEIFNNI